MAKVCRDLTKVIAEVVNFQGVLLSTDQFYNFIFQPRPESHEISIQ